MIKLENSPFPSAQFHALMPEKTGNTPDNLESFSMAAENRTLLSNSADGLCFEPSDPNLQPADRRGKFTDAERDNILCLLASPDGRFGSLRINAHAQIYTCQLGIGQQIYYRITQGNDLWLRPSRGEIEIDDCKVQAGESASVTDQSEITISALSESEFLLIVLW